MIAGKCFNEFCLKKPYYYIITICYMLNLNSLFFLSIFLSFFLFCSAQFYFSLKIFIYFSLFDFPFSSLIMDFYMVNFQLKVSKILYLFLKFLCWLMERLRLVIFEFTTAQKFSVASAFHYFSKQWNVVLIILLFTLFLFFCLHCVKIKQNWAIGKNTTSDLQ